MGRLDYFSVIIIAICVAAAAFLVYIGAKKVMDNGDKDAKIDELYNGVRTYDENGKESAYNIDEKDLLGEEEAAPAKTPSTPANTSTTPSTDEDLEYDFLEETPKSTTSSTKSNSSSTRTRSTSTNSSKSGSNSGSSSSTRTSSVNYGDYMVLAGSFKDQANAEREASRLRGLGFSNTSVERFDRGAYSVILVDRFSSRSSANSLKSKLADKGIDSYVKLKQ